MKKSILAILIVASLAACKPQDPAPLPPEASSAPAPAAAPAEPAPAGDPAVVDPAAAPADGTAPADGAAPAEGAAPAADAAPAAVAAVDGEAVYKKACVLCHGAGVAGAPKFGDAADWGTRAAQGEAMLFEHAIKGFTGQKGMMPAKGGSVGLSDDEVKAAVTHMVEHSK